MFWMYNNPIQHFGISPCHFIFIQELLSTQLLTIWKIPFHSGQAKIANCSAKFHFKPGAKGRLESPVSPCLSKYSIFCGNVPEISMWSSPRNTALHNWCCQPERWMEICEIFKLGCPLQKNIRESVLRLFGRLVGGNSVIDLHFSPSHLNSKPLGKDQIWP